MDGTRCLQSQPRSEIVSLLSHPIGLNAGSSQIQGFGLDPMYMGKIVDSHLWNNLAHPLICPYFQTIWLQNIPHIFSKYKLFSIHITTSFSYLSWKKMHNYQSHLLDLNKIPYICTNDYINNLKKIQIVE